MKKQWMVKIGTSHRTLHEEAYIQVVFDAASAEIYICVCILKLCS